MSKTIIRTIPCVVVFILINKLCLAFRLTPGNDFADKIVSLKYGLGETFLSVKFSFHPTDLLITIITTGMIWLILYTKRQNNKKYRKGIEYGSARCGECRGHKTLYG